MERGQASGGLVAPVGEDRGAHRGDEPEVPGDGPGVEQPELDLEVLGRGPARLGGGAYGVVEGEAEVPDRVPDTVGEGGDGRGTGVPVVQEQQVEIAARGEFTASVAADGDQGGALDTGLPGGGGEQRGEPVVGERRESRAARRPGPRLILEKAQPGRRVAAGFRVCGFGGGLGARHPAASRFGTVGVSGPAALRDRRRFGSVGHRNRRCSEPPAFEPSVRVRPGRVRPSVPGSRSRPARSRPCRRRSCRCGRPSRRCR